MRDMRPTGSRPSGRARIAVLLLTLLGAAASPALADAATLYVNEASPSCSNSGPGTASQPFCTISAAATRTTAGTTVLVSAGTYSEQVTPRSGAANNPVVFKAAPGATVTVRGQGHGFYVSGRTWITIEGFNVTSTTDDGMYISKSNNIKLLNNHVTHAGQPVSGSNAKGIRLGSTTDSLVSGNTIDHNSDYGLYLLDGSTRNTVVGNRLFLNARQFTRAASGIRLHGSPGNTITSNVSYDNEDSGIEVVTGSDNNLVVNNVTYGNGDHGIDVLDSVGARVVSNSAYDNITAGINVEGGSTGATLANNISVDNGIDSPRTRGNIRVDSASTSGTAINHDLVWLTVSGQVMFVWGSTSYTSLAALTSATGQEAQGVESDPRWASPSGGNFDLTSGSPAIDSADSGASGQPTTDVEGRPRVDDPAIANTGAGPRAYDDRGAYEFQGGGGPPGDAPPTAALSVTPASGTAPLEVTANASASSDDQGIASYQFTFGDGSPPVGPQPDATATHTYTTAATYTVTVTVTDTGGQTSTATKQVVVDSAGGQNLVGNPDFETDTSGWNTSGSGSGVTLARVAGGHSGGWAAKLTNGGTANATCVLNDSPNSVPTTSAGTYTASLWARADTAGKPLKLRFREYNGSTLVGSANSQITLTTAWQQVTVTYTITSPGSSLDLNAYLSSADAPPGTCFYADDASITRS